MDLGIKNRVALVTASSKGLGKAIAMELSLEGAKVAICARNKETLFKTREEIVAETGGLVKAYICDVTKKTEVNKMIEEVISEFGTIDILVCNAGGPPAGMLDEFTPDDYRDAVELNLLSTINLCYEVIPLMKKQKWGRIVTMTSVAAKQPMDSLILSNTARAGVLGFSKSISNQLAPYKITVNSVCPGYIKTERVENLAKSLAEKTQGSIEEFYNNIEKSIPMGRLGKPEEIAHAVAFLASEGAGYLTGVALHIDGGYIKGLF
jgi:3-oxoacyl-[acyl-carrier protein] reductase